MFVQLWCSFFHLFFSSCGCGCLRLGGEALDYFIGLTSESHREAWNSLLMLLLTKTLRLPKDKVGAWKVRKSKHTQPVRDGPRQHVSSASGSSPEAVS